MRPLIASTPRTMRDSCRALVLDKAGESSSKSGRISGMGFRPPEVDEFALTTSIRKPYSLSSALTRFGEGIDQGEYPRLPGRSAVDLDPLCSRVSSDAGRLCRSS